jgi:hypothetical protein
MKDDNENIQSRIDQARQQVDGKLIDGRDSVEVLGEIPTSDLVSEIMRRHPFVVVAYADMRSMPAEKCMPPEMIEQCEIDPDLKVCLPNEVEMCVAGTPIGVWVLSQMVVSKVGHTTSSMAKINSLADIPEGEVMAVDDGSSAPTIVYHRGNMTDTDNPTRTL